MTRRTAFAPTNWAKRVPTMLRTDGRPDLTAHYVLLTLATYADKDGTNARPGEDTLADDCHMTLDTVRQALERIQAAGLISKTACLTGGTTVWRLHLEAERSGPGVNDDRRERALAKQRERQRRYEEKRRAEASDGVAQRQADGAVDRQLTVSDTVRNAEVLTLPHTVNDGAGDRQQRCGTPSMTVSPPSEPQVTPATPALDLPIDLPIDLSLPQTAADRDAQFAEFWAAYPRRVEKKGARRSWDRAVKGKTDPAVILAGAQRYAREVSGQDPRYVKHPTTWLNNGCWDDEPQRPVLRAVGGHQPYRSPADQSIYDEEI